MSVYAINEVCWRLVHDLPFREGMKADPGQALAGLDLTENERTALLQGDVGALYRLGAHTFLLGHLSRYGIAGLTAAVYNERMRAEAIRAS
jgi:hypothetical protein